LPAPPGDGSPAWGARLTPAAGFLKLAPPD